MNACVRAMAVAVTLAAVLPTRSSGSALTVVEVAQPFATDVGLQVSTVTYFQYLEPRVPGEAVRLVGEASWVTSVLGKPVSANVAACAGIKTGCDAQGSDRPLYGDTLSVWIDLSAARDTVVCGWSMRAVVAATVECVLITAWRERTAWDRQKALPAEAHWIRLDVRGAPQYASMGGVFAMSDLGPRPRKSYYD